MPVLGPVPVLCVFASRTRDWDLLVLAILAQVPRWRRARLNAIVRLSSAPTMGSSYSTKIRYVSPASEWPTADVPSFTVHDGVSTYCVPHLALASFTAKRCAWSPTEAQSIPATDFDRAMIQMLEDRARLSMPTAKIKCFMNKSVPGAMACCDGICMWQLSPAAAAVTARVAPGVLRTWITLRNRTKVAVCFLMTTGLSTGPHAAVAHGLIRAGMLRHDHHTNALTIGMPVYPVEANMGLLDELLEVFGARPLHEGQPSATVNQPFEEPVVSSTTTRQNPDSEGSAVDTYRIEFTGEAL